MENEIRISPMRNTELEAWAEMMQPLTPEKCYTEEEVLEYAKAAGLECYREENNELHFFRRKPVMWMTSDFIKHSMRFEEELRKKKERLLWYGNQNQQHMSKTIGEKRVRTSFNPENNDTVATIKNDAAALINKVSALPAVDDEAYRLKAIAMTSLEEAAMWAVKAATYKPEE